MNKGTVEEPPATWLALSQRLGVPSPTLSLIARNLLAAQSDRPLPGQIPPPPMMEVAFVNQVINVAIKTLGHRTTGKAKEEAKASSITRDRLIRAALDAHQDMIGNNLYELVADELDVDILLVEKVAKDRYKALCTERKILAEERAYAREQAALQQAKASHRSAVADNSREAALGAHRQRPLPDAYKPGVPTPPAAPPEPRTPLGRPACFPQPGENVPLDEALRAAWIQGTAGMANERLAAEMELVKQYPPATIVDAYDAIELAYSSRPDKQKREMERKAAKLAKASAKPTSQAASTPTAQAPLPAPPHPNGAKKT